MSGVLESVHPSLLATLIASPGSIDDQSLIFARANWCFPMASGLAHRFPIIVCNDNRKMNLHKQITSYRAPPLIGAPLPSATRLSLISSLVPPYKSILHLHPSIFHSKKATSVPRAAASTFSGSYSSTTFPSVKVGSCFVFRPPPTATLKGVINFLGGAFVGATPDVAYRYGDI